MQTHIGCARVAASVAVKTRHRVVPHDSSADRARSSLNSLINLFMTDERTIDLTASALEAGPARELMVVTLVNIIRDGSCEHFSAFS